MPTADPRIRAARPADAETLSGIALRAKAHWGYSTELIELWADDLRVSPESCDGKSVWLLESEGIVAGFGEVLIRDEYAILDDLWTDPPHMGKGFGRALFQHLCAIATEAGAEHICLEADPFAKSFYEHMGARVVGEVQSESVPGRTLPLMQIDLPLP